ncbi:MAG: hypothetical protein Q8P67_08990 [archaeon]|nr:hypothetical protein [archaeon]
MAVQDHKSVVPSSHKNLRACLDCKMILTREQFHKGCPNCRGGTDTTDKFSGLMLVADPEKSWLARWFQLNNNVTHLKACADCGADAGDYNSCPQCQGSHFVEALTKPGIYAMEAEGAQQILEDDQPDNEGFEDEL